MSLEEKLREAVGNKNVSTVLDKEILISKFIEPQIEKYPGCDKDVLRFIAEFRYHDGLKSEAVVDPLFLTGYCYYFAVMLKEAFHRGIICCNGRSHIVWLDGTNQETDIAYDITGVYLDYEVLIPVKGMGLAIFDFMHVPGLGHNTSAEEIESLVNTYKRQPDLRRYV